MLSLVRTVTTKAREFALSKEFQTAPAYFPVALIVVVFLSVTLFGAIGRVASGLPVEEVLGLAGRQLLLIIFSPIVLIMYWLPIRVTAGPASKPWLLAGASLVPSMLLSPIAGLTAGIPASVVNQIFANTCYAVGLGWATVLVYWGVRVAVPKRALLAAAVYLGVFLFFRLLGVLSQFLEQFVEQSAAV